MTKIACAYVSVCVCARVCPCVCKKRSIYPLGTGLVSIDLPALHLVPSLQVFTSRNGRRSAPDIAPLSYISACVRV